MKILILLIILFQYCLALQSKKTLKFYSSAITQCMKYDEENPHLDIKFKIESSGFDEPQEFELKFKNINFFTALCTIPKDKEYSYIMIMICQINIVEYGIPHDLELFEEPPIIEGVDIINWELAQRYKALSNCYLDYAYKFNQINNYTYDVNDDGKFINIEGTIKKEINRTDEENTILNIYPFIEIDESYIVEKTKCIITFNGTKNEDKNAKMICNATHGIRAVFIESVPLERDKKIYVYFDVSDTVLNFTKASYSLFTSFKFWLFIITLLMF